MALQDLIKAIIENPTVEIKKRKKISFKALQEICLAQEKDLYETIATLMEAQEFIESKGLLKEYLKGRRQEFVNTILVDLDKFIAIDRDRARKAMRMMPREDLQQLYEITVDLFGRTEADRFFKEEGLEK
jgi:hypothetical protein